MSNFFTELNKLGLTSLSMTVVIKIDRMHVSFDPTRAIEDDAKNHIPPLMISGTAEELDTEFFNTVSTPLKIAGGLIHNIKEFEEGQVKLEEETKMNAAAKKEADKDNDKLKAKITSGFEKLEKMITEKEMTDCEKALGILTKIQTADTIKAVTAKKYKELDTLIKKNCEGTLFS
jgi:PRTRC genetic system protein E